MGEVTGEVTGKMADYIELRDNPVAPEIWADGCACENDGAVVRLTFWSMRTRGSRQKPGATVVARMVLPREVWEAGCKVDH